MRLRRQPPVVPPTCAQVMELITGGDVTELDAKTQRAVARHLRGCVRCRRCTDYLRDVVGRCRNLPAAPLSPAATEKLVSDLLERRSPP